MANERVIEARLPRPTCYRDGNLPATQAFAFFFLVVLGGGALTMAVHAAIEASQQVNATMRNGDLQMVFAGLMVLVVGGGLGGLLVLEPWRQRQTVRWGMACDGRISKVERTPPDVRRAEFRLIFEYDGPNGVTTGECSPVAPLGQDMKQGDPVTILCHKGQVLLYELADVQMVGDT